MYTDNVPVHRLADQGSRNQWCAPHARLRLLYLAAEAPRAAKHVNGDVTPMSLVFLPMTTSEQLVQSKLPVESWSSRAGMPRSRSALRCIRNQMRTYRNPQTQRPQTQRGQVRQGIVRVPTEPIIWARITLLTARADK